MAQGPIVLLLLGPSGAGKSSIKEHLEAAFGFDSAPKYTTRASRGTARDKREFIFCDSSTIPESGMLRFESYGATFGIQLKRIEESLRAGRDHVLAVGDSVTIGALNALYPRRVFAALVHCSKEQLLERLRLSGVPERVARWPEVQREVQDVYDWMECVDFVLHNSGPFEGAIEECARLMAMIDAVRGSLHDV